MPNRYSEVNNCPECGHKLWLRKVKERRFYNCLHCGYEKEMEQPKYREGTVLHTLTTYKQEFLFEDEPL